MKRNRLFLIGLTLLTTLVVMLYGSPSWRMSQTGQTPPSFELSAQAQAPTSNSSTPTLGTNIYQDPAQRFQIGIIEEYKVTTLNGALLVESPHSNLAYTVIARSRATDNSLTAASLTQIAIDTFSRGEGFIPGKFKSVSPSEILLPWTGSLTIRRRTQPISGLILARQTPANVLLLMISATEAQKDSVESTLELLADSLKPL